MTIPFVGHVIVLGYLATVAISSIENAILVGGLSALGAAIYSIGVPKDSVLQYETAVKADSFLVMAHGSLEEVGRAKAILGTADASRVDLYADTKVVELADHAVYKYGCLNNTAKIVSSRPDACHAWVPLGSHLSSRLNRIWPLVTASPSCTGMDATMADPSVDRVMLSAWT